MFSRRRLGIATCVELPELYAEERAFIPLLRERGIDATAVVWDDPKVDWARFEHVVLRSTWDYCTHPADFRAWLSKLEALGVQLHNSYSLVRWNLDKLYLEELRTRGAPLPPTVFVQPEEPVELAQLLEQRGWSDAVLKPTVSCGGYRTHRFQAGAAKSMQEELNDILRTSAAMVQPFLPQIISQGEWSLVFFEGELSHCVLKKAALGDFRVQHTHGGTESLADASHKLVEAGAFIVGLLPSRPLYVRVDFVEREHGYLLMEVEAIEPYLHTASVPGAALTYVNAIAERVLAHDARVSGRRLPNLSR